MKLVSKRATLLAVGLAMTAIAVAGQRLQQEATVLPALAFGSFAATRNSSDSVQYITCFTRSSGEGGCTMRDSAGVTRSCATTVPVQLEAIRTLRGDTRVDFQWEADGSCRTITAYVGSRHPAKRP